MSKATNNPASKGLRRWWTSPPRSGPRLIISPIEYRHLRAFGRVRIASGIVLTGLAITTLSYGGKDRKTYGWASWFLAGAAANLAYGSWELSIARNPTSTPTASLEARSLRPTMRRLSEYRRHAARHREKPL